MISKDTRRHVLTALGLATIVTAAAATGPAVAQQSGDAFDFIAPPSIESNRIYRVNRATGAMAVCWFNGTNTECLQGAGLAGPQTPGNYSLAASNKPSEKGVFRIDHVSGAVSNCWVQQTALVCSFPVR